MRLLTACLSLLGCFSTTVAFAVPSTEINEKILAQGVPSDAYNRLLTFMQSNQNREFVVNTYTCKNQPPESVKACSEGDRTPGTQTVKVADPRYVAIVDFTKMSSLKRFYFIDLQEGTVQNYYVSHGIGTGGGDQAERFSNIKDSRQTSLGFYVTGETYRGKYGASLRMYGLDKSNDDAYNRDIVMHGAWYAKEGFISALNYKTNLPFGRLGHSWGCPAVANDIAQKLIPLLKNGGLIYHYHADYADLTDRGSQIGLIRPSQKPLLLRTPPTRPVQRPAPTPESPEQVAPAGSSGNSSASPVDEDMMSDEDV